MFVEMKIVENNIVRILLYNVFDFSMKDLMVRNYFIDG